MFYFKIQYIIIILTQYQSKPLAAATTSGHHPNYQNKTPKSTHHHTQPASNTTHSPPATTTTKNCQIKALNQPKKKKKKCWDEPAVRQEPAWWDRPRGIIGHCRRDRPRVEQWRPMRVMAKRRLGEVCYSVRSDVDEVGVVL